MVKNIGWIIVWLATSCFAETKPEIRTFTRASDGRSLDAFVVSHDGEKVTIQIAGRKQFTLEPSIFSSEDQTYLKNWFLESKGMPPLDGLDERIKPGAEFRVELPGLEKTKHDGAPAGFTLRIPEKFVYPAPVPLMVFLAGGKGNHRINGGQRMAFDEEEYVLASFPYPENLKAMVPNAPEEQLKYIEDYHSAFIDELRRLVPNISESHRFIVGTSNGAHTIGCSLVMDWKAYTDFFRGYVLWEGGGCSLGANYRAARDKKKIFWVGWGEDSNYKRYAQTKAEEIESSGGRVWKEGVAGAGHGPTDGTWEAIKKWIESVAEKELEAMKLSE